MKSLTNLTDIRYFSDLILEAVYSGNLMNQTNCSFALKLDNDLVERALKEEKNGLLNGALNPVFWQVLPDHRVHMYSIEIVLVRNQLRASSQAGG